MHPREWYFLIYYWNWCSSQYSSVHWGHTFGARIHETLMTFSSISKENTPRALLKMQHPYLNPGQNVWLLGVSSYYRSCWFNDIYWWARLIFIALLLFPDVKLLDPLPSCRGSFINHVCEVFFSPCWRLLSPRKLPMCDKFSHENFRCFFPPMMAFHCLNGFSTPLSTKTMLSLSKTSRRMCLVPFFVPSSLNLRLSDKTAELFFLGWILI